MKIGNINERMPLMFPTIYYLKGESDYAVNFLRNSSVNCAGFALPLVAFMAWPISALMACSLPERNSATDFSFAAST